MGAKVRATRLRRVGEEFLAGVGGVRILRINLRLLGIGKSVVWRSKAGLWRMGSIFIEKRGMLGGSEDGERKRGRSWKGKSLCS